MDDDGKLVGMITKGDITRGVLVALQKDYQAEELRRYRASHLFEDIISDRTSLILRYNIKARDFTRGGHASSNIKKALIRLGASPQLARRCGIAIWDKPRRHQSHNNPFEADLHKYLSIEWAAGSVKGSLFRAETFREFADFLDDVALSDPGRLRYHGGHMLTTLSHGQGFLSYFEGRFERAGLFFLDEPEAALSPASQIRLVHALGRLEQQGRAQFVIATHSPILLGYPGAQIFCFDAPRITEVSLEETNAYQIYRRLFAGQTMTPQLPEEGCAASQESALGRRPTPIAALQAKSHLGGKP